MSDESDLTIWHRNMCRLRDENAIMQRRITELESGFTFEQVHELLEWMKVQRLKSIEEVMREVVERLERKK